MDKRGSIQPAALGIMCKAPKPGTTKTRLAAVIGSEQAASLAACFLRDVAAIVEAVPEDIGRRFGLVLQEDADFGVVGCSRARRCTCAGPSRLWSKPHANRSQPSRASTNKRVRVAVPKQSLL